jgi:hypothetical protein
MADDIGPDGAARHAATSAAKAFDRLVADIERDLGGSDRLSAIQRVLAEGFVGAAVTLQHLNTQRALGQPIDRSMLKAVSRSGRNFASWIGGRGEILPNWQILNARREHYWTGREAST